MSMTALVSAFCRAYHSGRSGAKIFDDTYAARLLTPEELGQIGGHMAAGETMQAVYDRAILTEMAGACGLRLVRWLGQEDVQRRYVAPCNAAGGRTPMAAPENVALCLLVK